MFLNQHQIIEIKDWLQFTIQNYIKGKIDEGTALYTYSTTISRFKPCNRHNKRGKRVPYREDKGTKQKNYKDGSRGDFKKSSTKS